MAFETLLASFALGLIVLGHIGIWVTLYNRINATGIHRRTIKLLEKCFVIAGAVIPLLLFLIEFPRLGASIFSWEGMLQWTWTTKLYTALAGLACVIMAPFWLRDRPQFASANHRFRVLESNPLRHMQLHRPDYIMGSSFRRMVKLPGNQIVSLERNIKRIQIDNLPKDLSGFKIAHLSDVHLTGQLSSDFYRVAIDWLIEQKPDMVVLSGDIVDYASALDQLKPVFKGLEARYGMYFVLGNHDRRLSNPMTVVEQLVSLGWTDLGIANASILVGSSNIELMGNELPWFSRNHLHAADQAATKTPLEVLRLGVSHSPDQLPWAIHRGCALVLCGHTHGGQIRLPVIGPVISPSWYGSRYASGVFHEKSTVMHVSRGISGTHPFRWGCMPEVSVLVLDTIA